MIPILAGTAKTILVSLLSERVIIVVFIQVAEWLAEKSSNSLDDQLVQTLKLRLKEINKI
jgi:transcription initiation factor IIE alpha subunit|tara:strand:- start:1863 stop:2042 length:180 start_codon:yes stop_codon:yes gene_type:complete